MARVYGRIHIQGTDEALEGDVFFEPFAMWYSKNGSWWAKPAYRVELSDQGRFEEEIAPGAYRVCMGDAIVAATVPAGDKRVALRDILQTKEKTE